MTVREVRRNVQSNIQNRRGDQGVGRQAGEVDQQEHAAQQAGVTREVGGMAGGQQRDLGGATGADLAIPGCSSDGSQNNKGPVRNKNVTFVKAGNCHKAGCKRGTVGRRHTAVTGSSTQTLVRASKAGKRRLTETITLDKSDSSDSETLEEMEQRLARMLEMKFKRRRGPDSLQ